MKVSLIVSIYNSPDFLNRVLASIVRQKTLPHEVIVSEDGESAGNRGVINQWKTKWPKPCKLLHLTQRDDGNRKPLAMNKAISKSEGDYIVFIDGDCVLRRDFISDHMKFAEIGSFLTGRRIELSPKITPFLTSDRISKGYLEKLPWALVWDSLIGDTHHVGRFFRVPVFLRKLLLRDEIIDIRGCNFSVHKRHLVSINGFTNNFSGAYGEDSEVEHRLKFLGVKMKSIKGAAIQFHLWHPFQTKDPKNQTLLQEILHDRNPRTTNGLAEAPNIP